MPSIPTPYTPSIRVSQNTAKQDKINILLGNWHIGPCDDSALRMFFARLAPAPTYVPFGETAGQTAFTSVENPWFSRHTHFDPTCATLNIRQGGSGRGSNLRPGRPLVSGQLTTLRSRRFPGDSFRPSARIVSLELAINPTRYVHHQPKGDWVEQALRLRRPPSQWEFPEPSLVAAEPRLQALDEISLDGCDNVLIGRAALSYGHHDAWPLHLCRYWHALIARFDGFFEEAGSVTTGSHLPIRFVPNINLRSVETYWEFSVADPLAWIREFEPALRQIGLASEARNYPNGYAADAIEGNCRSVTVRLGSGVLLRCYAKTTHRVRFEIEHDLVQNARPVGGRHVSDDPEQFFEWLNMAAADAASRVNEVLAHFERHQARDGAQASPMQFMSVVQHAIDDYALAETVLCILAANQSIASTRGLTAAIRKLVRAGILETAQRGGNRYIPAAFYRDACRRLWQGQFQSDTTVRSAA